MANYNRRAHTEVSQFLREGNLNAVHANELKEDFTMGGDSELDVFMQREFHDFDTGLAVDFKADSPPDTKPGEPAAATSMVGEYDPLDFMNAGTLYFNCQSVVIF